jgi:uncharacterized membrane protein HdeD (DUF308 family)
MEKTMNELSLSSGPANQWGWIVFRGLAAIVFGVLAFAWPEPTLAALVLLWGIYALMDGVLALIAAFQMRVDDRPVWPLAIVGLLGIAAGTLTFVWPGITALMLLMFIAAWSIVMGIFQIVTAIQIRKLIDKEWLLGLSGVLSVTFGVLMFIYPQAGALAAIWVIGAYAIVFGLLLIALGLRLRSL